MSIVRDLTMPKSDYKGHPCFAVDAYCPCRPCYNCHDCSPPQHSRKVYSDIFSCATNWSSGCPHPLPEPYHDLNRAKRCRRCGQYITPKGIEEKESEENVEHQGDGFADNTGLIGGLG